MGWSIGYDPEHSRDIGYGVPAVCDHPGCGAKIDRGLGYACGGGQVGRVENCGLFFCGRHLFYEPEDDEKEGSDVALCRRCVNGKESFEPTPDVAEWLKHKLTDESWAEWRDQNEGSVAEARRQLELAEAGRG